MAGIAIIVAGHPGKLYPPANERCHSADALIAQARQAEELYVVPDRLLDAFSPVVARLTGR